MYALGRLAVLVLLALLAAPASASALTATGARIAQHPGFVRVVVDFSGGSLEINEVEATDPSPGEGTARVEVRRSQISTLAIDRSAAGVRVRATQAAGRVVIRLEGARRAFKYLRVSALHRPERLVLDLYSAKPPSRAAEIRAARGGCLRLTSVSADGRGFRARAWSARVAYRVSTAQTGTLEAVADSAKDGSLVCLVQVRVGLNP